MHISLFSPSINYCYVTLTIIIVLVITYTVGVFDNVDDVENLDRLPPYKYPPPVLRTESIKWLSFFPFSHISAKKQLPKPPEFEF